MKEVLSGLLKHISSSDYLDLFLFPCIITAFFTELKFLRSNRSILPVFIYTAFNLAAYILNFTINFIPKDTRDFSRELLNLLVALVEFSMFYVYFRHAVQSAFVKIIMPLFIFTIIFFIAFYMYLGLFISSSGMIVRKIPDFLISLELLLLAVPCFLYYYDLLRKKPAGNLRDNPSFWITTGLLFYCITIIPFFIISKDLQQNNEALYRAAYALHYILFGFLFLAITKAIQCRKPLTT